MSFTETHWDQNTNTILWIFFITLSNKFPAKFTLQTKCHLQQFIGITIQTQTMRHKWIEDTDIKSHPYICSYLNKGGEMNLSENIVKLLVMCYYGNNEQAASLSFYHSPWAPRCSTLLLIHVKGQNALHNFFFATWFWFKLDRDYLKFNMVPDD